MTWDYFFWVFGKAMFIFILLCLGTTWICFDYKYSITKRILMCIYLLIREMISDDKDSSYGWVDKRKLRQLDDE